ncbi:TonB-dependent receptor [Aliikangiella sp. IMCC44632]
MAHTPKLVWHLILKSCNWFKIANKLLNPVRLQSLLLLSLLSLSVQLKAEKAEIPPKVKSKSFNKPHSPEQQNELQAVNSAQLEAQESTEPTMVITAQRGAVSLLELANNTAALDAKLLEKINHSHINEALVRIPGAWISRGNGQEHLTAIRSPVLTGPGSCGEFLMLQDGVPLRAPGFCNVNQLFDANTEQAQAVEVVRGANSALYGSNAIHAVMNIISQKPEENRRSINLEVGPHQFYRAKTSLVNMNDDAGLLFNFNLTHDGGLKDHSGYKQHKATLRHLTKSDQVSFDSILNLTHLNQNTAGYLQAGKDAYLLDAMRTRNDFPEAYRKAHSIHLQSKASGYFHNGVQWQLTPYFRSNEMEFLMHFLPGQPIENNSQQSLGLMWQAQHYFDSSELRWGIDTEFTDAKLRQSQSSPTNTGSAFLNATLPVGKHYDYKVFGSNLALYGRWEKQLALNWKLELNARFDFIDYDYSNNMLSGNTREDATLCGFGGCRYNRPDSRTDSFSNFSQSAAISYLANKDSLAYVKIDRAFRAPQATELYRLQNNQTISAANSVKADAIEIGYRKSTPQLFYEVNIFHMRKSDSIFQNSEREFVSGAKTSHKGLETLWRLTINQQWSITQNLSYAKHLYENSPNLQGNNNVLIKHKDIDTAPRLLTSSQVSWQVKPKLALELELISLSSYYTNPENTQKYAGHKLFNLRAAYQHNRHWESVIRIMNASDENYAERADYAFSNHRYFVGAGRSIYYSLQGRFN